MSAPSLEKAIRALLEPEIAGGLSAFDDVEILLSAWKEMHRERSALEARAERAETALREIAEVPQERWDDPLYSVQVAINYFAAAGADTEPTS